MNSVMNTTKWLELQKAMYELNESSPKWRTKCTLNGYISKWDGEWFYHFSDGGFKDIEWVEIKVENKQQKEMVLSSLKIVHVPGVETEHGYKIFGYIKEGAFVNYI